jgi:hypothetical protein
MVRVAGKLLPLTLSTEEAAQWLNTSAVRLQQRRGTGVLPVEPLTLGHRLRWPTTAIAQVLGLPWEIVTNDAGVSQDDADVHVIAATSGTRPDKKLRQVAATDTLAEVVAGHAVHWLSTAKSDERK